LKFTDAELKKRDRDHLHLSTIKGEWEQLKTKATTQNDEATKGVAHLIADTRGMIAHMGDTSNLILDPDLDSYYLMDITLLALPQTQDRLAQMIAFGQQALSQPPTYESKRKLSF